jgi:hypothetical protein
MRAGIVGVEIENGLELVEDEGHAAAALCCQLRG